MRGHLIEQYRAFAADSQADAGGLSMMFFKKKPALIQIVSATTPRPVRKIAEIKVKAAGKPDSDGRHRRMLRTVEDNRLL
ncbi:hypothetical protein [Pararhizobium sp.]|uniref:hypothetical protein n=2 Tax=Pararhizobium sp. TaxID=1977563 RepID=UPI003BAB1951